MNTLLQRITLEADTLIFLFALAMATVLAALAGLAVVRVCRNRAAPLRCALATVALVLVAAAPLLTLSTDRMRIGLLRMPIERQADVRASTAQKVDAMFVAPAAKASNSPGNSSDATIAVGEARWNSFAEDETILQADEITAVHAALTPVAPSVWRMFGSALVAVWAIGVLVAAATLLRGLIAVSRLRRALRPATDSRLCLAARESAARLGMRTAPPLFVSSTATVPFSLGMWRPSIVFPNDAAQQLSDDQLRAVLLHETGHVARGDHWVGLLQRLAMVCYWWNLPLRRLSASISDSREEACDNFVLRLQGGGGGYAQVLVDWAARAVLGRSMPATIGLLDSRRGGLEKRVARLLGEQRDISTRLGRIGTLGVALFGVLLVATLLVAGPRADRAKNEPAATDGTDKANTVTTVRVDDRESLYRALREAKPGTQILIAPGTYQGGMFVDRMQGTEGRPILIAAADPQRPPVIRGGKSCLHLRDVAHVELRDLVFVKGEANGLNIDDGGSYDSPSHHVVLKNLTLRDIGSDRNHDAIKLSGLDDFRIEGCTVERWGDRGSAIDMVGCHRGLVVDCTFRDGDKIYASGVQIKGGSSQVTVWRCRFENAGGRAINLGGNTGASYFRPKTVRYEAKDLVVEDCTFIGSMAPVAFVGVDGAVVRHNTFYRPTRWVMRILQENQGEKIVACRNGKFTNNIVVFRSDELAYPVNFGPKTEPKSFQFADNFWFCIDRPEKTRRAVRLPTEEQGGVYGSDPRFRDADQGDLRVATDGPAKVFGPRAKREK